MQLIRADLDEKIEIVSIMLRDNYGQPRIVAIPLLRFPECCEETEYITELQAKVDYFARAVVEAIDRFAVRSPSELK